MIQLKFDSFEDTVEYVRDYVGGDFEKTHDMALQILDDPHQSTGPQALRCAIKLATYRYRIGTAAQAMKIVSAQTKSLDDRLKKDALLMAYDGLFEIINVLKLCARHDHGLTEAR